MATVHIESEKNDIAKIVLMPGDPKRAEYIARRYLTKSRLVNVRRGMTAYTGYYKDKLVTVFPSGMGIPSMGIYSYELYKNYEVDVIIRIGSCGAYVNGLKLNDVILVDNAVSDSTYAKLLDNYLENSINSTQEINDVIISVSQKKGLTIYKGNIYSSDVFYEKENTYLEKATNYNVIGVEMETFALFNNARILNKKASALLTVSDSFCFKDVLTPLQREQGLDNMITLALESCLKL